MIITNGVFSVHKKITGLLAGLALLSLASSANAVLMWSFDNPDQFVGPSDIISMNATLFNDTPDAVDIGREGSVSIGFGGFSTIYQFSFGDVMELFSGISLDGGESYAFIFGTFVPNPAPVALGIYEISFASITIAQDDIFIEDSTFRATVGGAQVPVPATVLLLGLGLAGLGWSRRKKA